MILNYKDNYAVFHIFFLYFQNNEKLIYVENSLSNMNFIAQKVNDFFAEIILINSYKTMICYTGKY